VLLENGKKITVRAIKGRELSAVGEHVAQLIMHVYSAKGTDAASLLASSSRLTLDAIFSILEIVSSFKKKAIMDLGIADLIKVVDACIRVNKLEEIAPVFFSLKTQIQSVVNSLKKKSPEQKPT